MCLGLRHLAAGPTLCGAGGPRRRGGAPWRILPSSWILLVLVAASGFTLADKPPRFIVEPESKIVKVHSEVRLHCRVEPASATVRWKWDGIYLNLDDQKDMHTEGSTLVIRPFRHRPKEFSHTGAYQCVASTGAGSIISRNATLERASLEQFEEGPGDIYVNATEGNVALVPCLPPQGNPPPITSFAVNNTMLDLNPERHMIMPSGNLQIAKVRQSDQGTYQCVATNPVTGLQRRAPSKVHLKVIAPTVNSAPRIVRAPNPVEVIADGNLTLECVVEGSPVPVVTWEKFGGQLPEGRYTQKLGNLIIHQMEYVDGGTYICRAAGGSGRSNVYSPTKVEVLEPPKIKVPPRDTVVKVGSTVTLHCQAQTNERVQSETRWLHNARSITPDRSTVITENENETSLSIHNVQKSHAGMYQCLARNKLGTVYAAAWLQVRDPSENITAHDLAQASNQMQDIAPDSLLPPSRPTIQVPPTNMTVVSGTSIVLPCTPQKISPDLEIVWHKDAKPITPRQTFAELSRKVSASDADSSREGAGSTSGSFSRYKVAPSSGALQIFNARPEDGGQFTCILSNQGGLDTATAYLNIPDPSTTSRTGGVVLKTPPTGSVDTLLPVTSSPGNVNVTKILEEPGEGPSGRGRGRGDRGRGRGKKKGKKKGKKGGKKKKDPPAREPTGDAILVPPSKPEVSKLSDTSVLLKWDVPHNDGLPITFFKVQYKNLHPRESRYKGWHTLDEDINSNTRNHEVVGLHPGSTYKFRVVGVYSNNDNKQGPNSARFTLAVQGVKHLEPPVECPVIVGARPLSATEIRIEWQYLDVHQSPIEGFKVLYKPFHSKSEFQAQTIPFPDQRVYTITGLWPSTEYTLNMQSFNHAGSSVLSNTVVKRTLATSDIIDVTPGFVGPAAVQPSVTTTVVSVYQPNPINTQSSSELLYTVLGVVLGVMMLLLIIFMILCGWKQRQQRQMMAALNANIRKFDDPSKSIYIDSMRKKYGYTGGFVLNGITPTMTNGHAPPVTNGHIPIPNYTSEQQNNHSGTLNGSKINISVNPLTAELDSRNMDDSGHPSLDNDEIPSRFSDYDPNNDGSETDSRNGQSIAELRSSLKEALSQTVPGLQPNYGEITYGSVENSCPPPADSGEELTPPEFYSPPDEGERLYDPPDYNSVQRISPDELSPPLRTTSYDHDMVVVPRRQSHEHIPLTNMSQSDRLSTFSKGSPSRNSGDQGGDGAGMDPVGVSLRGHAKPHKRRRRRHRDQSTKEMATNTDMSSNEGTLDQPRYNTLPHQPRNVPRWEPPTRAARTPSPVSSPHFTSELLEYTKVPPYRGHNAPTTNTTSLLAYTDLPRVHDYPPSPDEDGEYGN